MGEKIELSLKNKIVRMVFIIVLPTLITAIFTFANH